MNEALRDRLRLALAEDIGFVTNRATGGEHQVDGPGDPLVDQIEALIRDKLTQLGVTDYEQALAGIMAFVEYLAAGCTPHDELWSHLYGYGRGFVVSTCRIGGVTVE